MTTRDGEKTQPVIINGERDPGVPPGISLIDLLNRRGINPKEAGGIAVALNDRVIKQKEWKGTMVGEGDRVEIVTATQGG